MQVANPIYDSAFKQLMDMNIEDEIQTSLNNRDRKIMKRDATIREQAEQLQQKRRAAPAERRAAISPSGAVAHIHYDAIKC